MSTTQPDSRAGSTDLDGLIHRLLDHESGFHGFLRRRVPDEAIAADLFQQSLLRAVQHHHDLDSKENVVAWFYRVLRNAVVDYYRAQAADSRKAEGLAQELATAGDQAFPSPDEIRPTVCACFERLLPTIRPAYAELLQRIDLQGEPPDRVAADLQLTKNNLTVRLHRARQALRAALEDTYGICSKHGCLNCTCE